MTPDTTVSATQHIYLLVGFLGVDDGVRNLDDDCEASDDDDLPSPVLGTLKSPQLSPSISTAADSSVPDLNEELTAVKRRKVVKKNK